MGEVIDIGRYVDQTELICECDSNSFMVIKFANHNSHILYCSECYSRIEDFRVIEVDDPFS